MARKIELSDEILKYVTGSFLASTHVKQMVCGFCLLFGYSYHLWFGTPIIRSIKLILIYLLMWFPTELY